MSFDWKSFVTPKKTSVTSFDESSSPWVTRCSSFVMSMQHLRGFSVTTLASWNMRHSWSTVAFSRSWNGEAARDARARARGVVVSGVARVSRRARGSGLTRFLVLVLELVLEPLDLLDHPRHREAAAFLTLGRSADRGLGRHAGG